METRTLELSPRERWILMKYGYPFDAIRKQCKATEDSPHVEPITDDPYWWAQVLGNLAISVNKEVRPGRLADEIHALADLVEDLLFD